MNLPSLPLFESSCVVPPFYPLSSYAILPAVQLKTVGVALSLRMTEHSSDLWLGFGSFVDKPVSPYINVHPSKINNPCRSDRLLVKVLVAEKVVSLLYIWLE